MYRKNTNKLTDIQDLYFSGKYREAFSVGMECAKKGDEKCMRSIGWSYYEGKGCEYDLKKSMSWFNKAADAGDAEAYFGMGTIHYQQENYKDAYTQFNLSAENGFIPALRWVGIMHEYGLGTTKNINQADIMYIESSIEGSIRGARAHVSLLLRGHSGLWGRIIGVPLLFKVLVSAFFEALRDENSQRLM